jgi:hypothetical protein
MYDDNDWARKGPYAYSSRRRRSGGPSPGLIAVVVVALIVLVSGWLFLRSEPQADPAPASPVTTVPDRPADLTDDVDFRAEPPPPLDLPEMDESDDFVRGLVTRLSSRPQLAGWFVSDDLVHRFVVAVVNLSGGMSPASELTDLAPEGAFGTLDSGNGEIIDPASYRRYDRAAETFASVDTRGTAQLFHQLYPLFEEAFRSLGIRDLSFEDAFARAVRNVLAVDVLDAPYAVELEEGVYVFADPDLESRSDAEKHLMRMGPENARLVQAKVDELARTIGLDAPDRR